MRTLGRALFSLIEAGTLAGWLALALAGQPVLAILVLLAGLLLEHLVSYNVNHDRPFFRLRGQPLGAMLAIAGLETMTWAGWLALVPVNEILSFAFLFGFLAVGHALELNRMNDLPLLGRLGRRLKQGIGITAVESVVGVAWLALTEFDGALAFAVLFAGLWLEHFLSSRINVKS